MSEFKLILFGFMCLLWLLIMCFGRIRLSGITFLIFLIIFMPVCFLWLSSTTLSVTRSEPATPRFRCGIGANQNYDILCLIYCMVSWKTHCYLSHHFPNYPHNSVSVFPSHFSQPHYLFSQMFCDFQTKIQ